MAEIASELNCAPRTVDRRWSFSRKWLEPVRPRVAGLSRLPARRQR
ncbi:MAG: hypothetical protein JOY54_15165 [Acidobacteriaceae bacterium]|nr:hypothetical protein [Acidobacteriaceae bacterium]